MTDDLAAGIGVYVTLTPRGPGFVGCCPFHEEATPSFVVVPSRQVWYCFGCGRSGTTLAAFRAAWRAQAGGLLT
jgi:DNA primase